MLGLRSESNLSAHRQRGAHPCVCLKSLTDLLNITLCLAQRFSKCQNSLLLKSVAFNINARTKLVSVLLLFVMYSQPAITFTSASVCVCVYVPEAHNGELFTDIAFGLVFGRFCRRHSVQDRKPNHRLRLQPHPINKLPWLQLDLIGHLRKMSKHKQPIREGFQKEYEQHKRITHKQCSLSEIKMMDGAFPTRLP